MANQIIMYLNDLWVHDTKEIQVHVVDCVGRGFTVTLLQETFKTALKDGTLENMVNIACVEVSEVFVVVRCTKLPISLWDTLDEHDGISDDVYNRICSALCIV